MMLSEPATPKQLAEIRARLAQATPGVVGYRKGGYCNGQTYRLGVQFTESGGMSLGNAVFHSHAADDVSTLLALVDAQAAEIERLKAQEATMPTTFTSPDPGQLNRGHGHVRPRPDGVKARCGGPALCRACQQEQAAEIATLRAFAAGVTQEGAGRLD